MKVIERISLPPSVFNALTGNLAVTLEQLRLVNEDCLIEPELIGLFAKPKHCQLNLENMRLDRPYWELCHPKASLAERTACWWSICDLIAGLETTSIYAVDPMAGTVRIPELMDDYSGRNLGGGIYQFEKLDRVAGIEVVDAVSHPWGGGIVQLGDRGELIAYTAVVFDGYAPAMLLRKDLAVRESIS